MSTAKRQPERAEPIRSCPFCSATGTEATRQEFLAKITGCMNCRADIVMCGEWTGDGWAAVQRMLARAKAGEFKKATQP